MPRISRPSARPDHKSQGGRFAFPEENQLVTVSYDEPTLRDIEFALRTAQIAHKKAILRGDTNGVTATLNYLSKLTERHEAMLDRDIPAPSVPDHSYDSEAFDHGFRIISDTRSAC